MKNPRVERGHMTGGRLSNYALDNFVAPNLSKLTECTMPDMSNYSRESEYWVGNFILNSMFRFNFSSADRHFRMFFLRRAQSSFREYESAHDTLHLYTNTDGRKETIFFEALFHIESCIAQMWQAFSQTREFIKKVSGEDKKLYEKGDESKYERLNDLYNISRYAGDNIPEESTVPIWLTNTGVESNKISLSFTELSELLGEIGDLADTLSNPA